jgi:hypothetical protein
MATHFSLDIETLSTKTDALVLSIGATQFDETKLSNPLHISVDIDEQLAMGREVSQDTLRWWFGQLVNMSEVPFPSEITSVEHTIMALNSYFDECPGGSKEAVVWVRGPHFDWVILESLASWVNVKLGVRYSNIRDQRTFCAQQPYTVPVGEGFIPHDALEDAEHQARYIQQVAHTNELRLA